MGPSSRPLVLVAVLSVFPAAAAAQSSGGAPSGATGAAPPAPAPSAAAPSAAAPAAGAPGTSAPAPSSPAAPGTSSAAAAPEGTPPSNPAGAVDADSPGEGTGASSAAAPSTPPKPVVPATGYSFGGPASAAPPERAPRARSPRADSAGTDALMTGFETEPGGSTRLFVALSKPATFDAKAGPSTITYVLKGVRVERRNNENPLITVHFNTPVNTARLVPHGRDLWFVVDLRANVQPTTTMDVDKSGAATLSVLFPKGEYLGGTPGAPGAATAPVASGASSPSRAPASAPPPAADAGSTAPAKSASLSAR